MIRVASVTITTPCNLYTSAGQRFLQAPRRATGRNTRRVGGEEVSDDGGEWGRFRHNGSAHECRAERASIT